MKRKSQVNMLRIVKKCTLLILLFTMPVLGLAAKWETVKYVIDGDTIITNRGETIRLLSINTPEIAYKGKVGEAGGKEAKAWLKKKLLGQKIRLEKNVQHHDKFGRTLAFIFNEQGENINIRLIEKGLAILSIYPPNIKYLAGLQGAQVLAESKKLGLWNQPEYRVRPVQIIPKLSMKSWGRFNATVRTVQKMKKGYKLWLAEHIYIWVANRHLSWVRDIESYKNKAIEVRGWPRKWGGSWSINVKHESQIILLF